MANILNDGFCYLCEAGVIFMTVCLSVCLLAGLRKYNCLELQERNQKMGLGST